MRPNFFSSYFGYWYIPNWPRQTFFWKTLFKPNLWLFSTFFDPFWDFYYPLKWSMYKIWVLWLILIYRNPFWNIFFENVLKGPFQPLCNMLSRTGEKSNSHLEKLFFLFHPLPKAPRGVQILLSETVFSCLISFPYGS